MITEYESSNYKDRTMTARATPRYLTADFNNAPLLALADLMWSLQEGDARAVGRVALSLTKRFKAVDEARAVSVRRRCGRGIQSGNGRNAARFRIGWLR